LPWDLVQKCDFAHNTKSSAMSIYTYIVSRAIYIYRYRAKHDTCYRYGVASVSRIDKILGLFCKRDLYKRRYSAKETYKFIDPTKRIYHDISRKAKDLFQGGEDS